VAGKEIRQSLKTTDRKLAERELKKRKEQQSQIDRSKSKITLAELCNQWLENHSGFPNRKRLSKKTTLPPESKNTGQTVALSRCPT
jgi:hypothetical protein